MARVIRDGGPVVPGEVVDATAEAAGIVEAAKKEAQQILEAARAEAGEIERDADARGRAAADTGAAAMLAAAAKIRDGALAEAEAEATRIALSAARHIVTGELALAPDKTTAIVRDVLDRARRARRVRVEVHPDDAPRIRTALPGVEVIEAPAVTPGGCIVHTDLGTLDARLEVRFDALEKALLSE